jgi:hypothetical protein
MNQLHTQYQACLPFAADDAAASITAIRTSSFLFIVVGMLIYMLIFYMMCFVLLCFVYSFYLFYFL